MSRRVNTEDVRKFVHYLSAQSSAEAYSGGGFKQDQERFQDQLVMLWQARLSKDYPQYDAQTRQSIIYWLLDDKIQPLTSFSNRLIIYINCRYQRLQQRYLDVEPAQAYANLIEQLVLLIELPSGLEEDRHQQRAIVSMMQQIIQEILSKSVIKEKIARIAKHTADSRLRNAFLLAELEEYCLKRLHASPQSEQSVARLDAQVSA